MRAAKWMSVCGALVLIGVAGSLAQDDDAADLLQGMLDAVDAQEPEAVPADVTSSNAPAETGSMEQWEPRPLSDIIGSSESEAVDNAEEMGDEAAEDLIIEEMVEEEPIIEEMVSEEPVLIEEEPEEGDPLAEVMEAVKAASNETAVVEEELAVPEEVAALAELTAEVDALEEEAAEAEPTDDVGMADIENAAVDEDGQLISVRLNKVGLEEAITLFAQLSGANIIVPELTEAAQISVSLKDVEWRPALQSILDSYNYELYQKVPGSNVYSVRRRPAGAPDPQVVETFKLQYATVPNAAELVRDLLPESAKVSEFASRNMLVVKSTESAISEVRAVLQAIDKVRQQVFIESKFMELSDSAQKDLGIDWQVLQSYSAGTSGSTEQSYTRENNDSETSTTLLSAEGQRYDEGSSFVNSGSILGGVPVLEGLTPSMEDVSTEGASKVLTSVLSADEFRVVLSALQENQGVNVVSNPKVIVANEEKANISIIRREPNLKQERREALNDNPDSVTYVLDPSREFFDYGIKLDVTPSINTTSNITVRINPSLTRKYGDKEAGSSTYPIIDEKSIETVFNLANGQTAAIGGLTEIEDGEIERKVPVLGSIPFLGRLFSWKQTVRGQKETIIFVTVGLANTTDINMETGLPEDTELARRQIIRDANSRQLRAQGREYYLQQENDKLRDMLKAMHEREAEREEKRARKGLETDQSVEADLQHAMSL